MDFLEGTGRVRLARARSILALDELIRLVRPGRSYATWEEWVRVARPPGCQEWTDAAARRAVFRLKKELYRVHCTRACLSSKRRTCSCSSKKVVLEVETVEGESSMRIHVDVAAIADLVELHLRFAREVDERISARHEDRDEIRPRPELDAGEITRDYRDKTRPFWFLRRKYGAGSGRLRGILEGARVSLRHRGQPKIEERRPPSVIARALATFDRGGSIRAVARVLAPCSRRTAARFLARHDRRPPLPPTDPPRLNVLGRGHYPCGEVDMGGFSWISNEDTKKALEIFFTPEEEIRFDYDRAPVAAKFQGFCDPCGGFRRHKIGCPTQRTSA